MNQRRYGVQTEQDWQKIRDQVQEWAKQSAKNEDEFETGVIVGDVRTKTFPENVTPGQQTQVAFVCNVRLLNHMNQPLVRDVLVANQARQWVADGDGTPVLLKGDSTGRYQIIGRAAISTESVDTQNYRINDIGGLDLSFIFGLECVEFQSLSQDVQDAINQDRASRSLIPLDPADLLYIDPFVHVHGPMYLAGYLPLNDSTRGGTTGGQSCQQSQVLVPWDDTRWRWGSPPVGWSSQQSSWNLREIITTCTP